MEPTLKINDRIVVETVSEHFRDVRVGSIVVFHAPRSIDPAGEEFLVKRVVAVAGDKLSAHDGRLYLNDAPLEELYLQSSVRTDDFPEILIPDGMFFAMGDNRGNSQDSRFFGAVPQNSIIGCVLVRVWPLGSLGGV
jgi:signal peptidase I